MSMPSSSFTSFVCQGWASFFTKNTIAVLPMLGKQRIAYILLIADNMQHRDPRPPPFSAALWRCKQQRKNIKHHLILQCQKNSVAITKKLEKSMAIISFSTYSTNLLLKESFLLVAPAASGSQYPKRGSARCQRRATSYNKRNKSARYGL